MVSILHAAIEIEDGDLETVRSTATAANAHKIFNPDERRLQAYLGGHAPLLRRLERTLRTRGFLVDGMRMGDAVALRSLPGCKRQAWHTDFDPNVVLAARRKPLGVLLAVEDGTRLDVHPSTRHVLGAGDVLLFEGDVVHAASAYEDENVRVHVYVESDEVQRRPDTTYLVE